MMKEPIFSWDKDNGIASCIIEGYNQAFVGIATCHPEDADMMSEKTGCDIAYRRAVIKALRYYRDAELKPALAALKQLYYSMNRSKRFNPKSYENIMLQRQIQQREFDLNTTKSLIAEKEQKLNALIKDKEDFYQHIRKNRKANNQ